MSRRSRTDHKRQRSCGLDWPPLLRLCRLLQLSRLFRPIGACVVVLVVRVRFMHVVSPSPAPVPAFLAFCGHPNLHWKNQREGDLATPQQMMQQCQTEWVATSIYHWLLQPRAHLLSTIPMPSLWTCDVRLRLHASAARHSASIALDKTAVPTPLLLYPFPPEQAVPFQRATASALELSSVDAALSATFVVDALLGNYQSEELIYIERDGQTDAAAASATSASAATSGPSPLSPPLPVVRYGFHSCLQNRDDDDSALNHFREGSVLKLMQQMLEMDAYRQLNHAEQRQQLVSQLTEVIDGAHNQRATLTSLLQLLSGPERLPGQPFTSANRPSLATSFFRRLDELKQLRALLLTEASVPLEQSPHYDPSSALHSTLARALASVPGLVSHRRRRVAVLWCVSTYQSRTSLPSCACDSTHMTARLRELGFECVPMLNVPAQDFLSEWDLLTSGLEPDDLLLFYFSGHGFRRDQHTHLVPPEYDGDAHATTVCVERLRQSTQKVHVQHRTKAMEAARPHTSAQLYTVMLLDCCAGVTDGVGDGSASSSASSSSTDASAAASLSQDDQRFLQSMARSLPAPSPVPSSAPEFVPVFVGALKSPGHGSQLEHDSSATAPPPVGMAAACVGPVAAADIFIAGAAMPGQFAYSPRTVTNEVEDCSFFTQGLMHALAIQPPLPLLQLCAAADRHLRANTSSRHAPTMQQVWIECTPTDENIKLAQWEE